MESEGLSICLCCSLKIESSVSKYFPPAVPARMSGPLLLRADSAAAPHEIRHDRLRKDNTPSSQKSSVEAVPCAVSRRNQRGRPGEIHAEVKFLGNRFAIGCLHDRRLTTGARQIWSQNAKRSNRPQGHDTHPLRLFMLWALLTPYGGIQR